MTCFFIGHRNANESIMPRLEDAVRKHIIDYGVTKFVVGQYGSFDRMATCAVIKAKRLFSEISLSILLPYHPFERDVMAPDGYDSTFYPPGMENVPRRFAILRANKYMITHCDYLIAYAWQPGSKSKQLVEFARQHNIMITQLANDKDLLNGRA